MLTKTDLNQIGSVIDRKLEPIRKDLNRIGDVIDEKLAPVRKDLTCLKKKVSRIDRTVNLIVRNYDEADVKLQRRVRKIEHHLALPEEN